MCELGQKRSDFYILVADLAASFQLGEFINCCQGRCINTGIAEQNMVGIAAGLAMEGKIPWINSIAPFATLRCAEQIRTDLCYNNLHAVILAAPAQSVPHCVGDTARRRRDRAGARSAAQAPQHPRPR